MRRSLTGSGLLITGLLLLGAAELALFAALFKEPPRQHSDAFIAAQQEVERNPTGENYVKLGRQTVLEEQRPAWKDPEAIQYYGEVTFGMIAVGFGIVRVQHRLRLGRDLIRISHRAAK